jgi:hypothetical protein
MNVEAFIRDCAARNYSKSHTAQLLGIRPSKLNEILETLPLPKVIWAPPGKCAGAQYQRQQLHNTLRGRPQNLTNDDRERLAIQCRARAPKFTAFGVTDTLPNLIKRFAKVGHNSVVRRIHKGMDLELALATPRRDRELSLKRKPDSHPWRKMSTEGFAAHQERITSSATEDGGCRKLTGNRQWKRPSQTADGKVI